MSIFLIILLVLLALSLLILIASGFYFIRYMTKPKRMAKADVIEQEECNHVWKDIDGIPSEPFDIIARDGYLLHATLLYTRSPESFTSRIPAFATSSPTGERSFERPVEGSEGSSDLTKWVIITHGYTSNRLGSYKYAHMFLSLGYNCCIWDLRHHGENQDCYCSMGYYEPKDIIDIAAALRYRFGSDISIGLHGESLGSASSILALGLTESTNNKIPELVEGSGVPVEGPPDLSVHPFAFLVSDCGFCSLKDLMCYLSGTMFHLPTIFAWTASTINLLVHGYTFFSIEPIKALTHTTTPILFIHGQTDDFITPSNAERMYNALRSRPDAPKTELYLCPGAQHALSYATDPVEYERRVGEFLREIGE